MMRDWRRGAPPEREEVEPESMEVQAVRDCIAKVMAAREAHAEVVRQRDTLVQELNQSTGERAAAQAQLSAREKEIALAGGELPEEPFPEEEEILRLNRHVRMRQERVRSCEDKVRESQTGLDARIQEMEASWGALGTATGERLLKRFREAAVELRDTQLEYFALFSHFCKKWNPSCWKHVAPKLAIGDPMTAELILNPLHIQVAARWPASAQTLLKDVEELRAAVDAVK